MTNHPQKRLIWYANIARPQPHGIYTHQVAGGHCHHWDTSGVASANPFSSESQSPTTQCVSNLRQLGVGLHVFVANNGAYPVLLTKTNEGYATNDRTWVAQIEQEGLGISPPETNYYQHGVWLCPSARWTERAATDPTSYGYNRYGMIPLPGSINGFGLQGHFDSTLRKWAPISESEVSVPSDMMAIGDCFNGSVEFTRGTLADAETFGNIRTRHQGKANVVFCDGHVESPLLKFLLEDISDAALVRWNRDHQPHRDLLQ